MTPELYRLLHVVGALLLFLGLGGILSHDAGKAPKLSTMLHGIGLLVLVVAGVGVMHKSSPAIAWQPWVFVKIGGWVLLGALPVLVNRGLLSRLVAVLLVLAIGAASAWIGLAPTDAKPF